MAAIVAATNANATPKPTTIEGPSTSARKVPSAEIWANQTRPMLATTRPTAIVVL